MGKLLVQLLHIFLFAPFFIFIGLYIPSSYGWYLAALLLGLFVVIWWIILWARSDYTVGWLVWHLLIIGGLLIACGIGRQHAPSIVFSLLLALGFAAFGYHLTRWIQDRLHFR